MSLLLSPVHIWIVVVAVAVLILVFIGLAWFCRQHLREIPCELWVNHESLQPLSARLFHCCLFCGETGIKSHCSPSEIVKIPIVSFCPDFFLWAGVAAALTKPSLCPQPDENGATAEERQNNQNAGLEGEESRPESRPLLQETQSGMTKASPPLEDEDRGLGDSLPNTTNSSQTSLSGLPTFSSAITPRQSPSASRPAPVDVVRSTNPSLPPCC